MFEVFAGMCFYAAAALKQCDDFVVESYDDPLTCEIVAADYRQDSRWINPACIPSPEVEPIPEGEEVQDPVGAVTSFFVDNQDAAALVQVYASQEAAQ